MIFEIPNYVMICYLFNMTELTSTIVFNIHQFKCD